MKITIDGPSGAGKSSIAKTIAKQMNIIYIDTGAMYRAVGFFCNVNSIDTTDDDKVSAVLDKINIDIKYVDGTQNVVLNNENITGKIRTPEVSMAASNVAKIGAVRTKLVELQRLLASKCDVIMDGRDAGTNILPDAEIKIFLTASPEKRAERRHLELINNGEQVEFSDVLKDIIARDKNDTERKISPLKAAEDAIFVDTSELDFEQSVDAVKKLISERNV